MPIITFELFDSTRREIEAESGTSVMANAVHAGIEGIEAECGGTCTCATCHVYVDEGFAARLPQPSDNELEMLDFVAAERRPNSRLSCQIVVAPEIDGLLVRIPETQLL